MATDGLWVRDGGSWKRATPKTRVSSTWFTAQKLYAKAGGSWRLVWQDRAPTTVSTFNSTISQSWRDNGFEDNGWRTSNDDVYQGEWDGWGNHRGLYFYDSANIRSVLGADGGRVIDKVRIYLRRSSASHGFNSSQNLYAWVHNYDYSNRPSGIPLLAGGPHYVGSFDRGEAKWVTLPDSWGEHLRDGNQRGIAFYQSDGSPYIILDGRSVSSTRGRLEITHS